MQEKTRQRRARKARNSIIGMKIMEKALDSENGIRIKFEEKKRAEYIRAQIHLAKRFEEDSLLEAYDPDDALRYKPKYAKIHTELRGDREFFYLYIQNTAFEDVLAGIEEL